MQNLDREVANQSAQFQNKHCLAMNNTLHRRWLPTRGSFARLNLQYFIPATSRTVGKIDHYEIELIVKL